MDANTPSPLRVRTGLVAGPLIFLAILAAPTPADLPPQAQSVAAVAALMALWWITEAIPIPATALLPLLLFPLLGVQPTGEVSANYGHHLIYLFLGGFLIATTMERWALHRRIALHTIRIVGVGPRRIILGFMVATAALSMWISNTATAMMMVPIGLAVLKQTADLVADQADTRPGHFRFGTALMLGIAYGASLGGLATLIGTPPNTVLAAVADQLLGLRIGFAEWFFFALPLSVFMLLVAWVYLVFIALRPEVDSLPGGRELVNRELAGLGPMTTAEKRVAVVFALVATGWIARSLLPAGTLGQVNDAGIAIAGAIALFLMPSGDGRRLLDWDTAVGIPWGILILFGGGLALAGAFKASGLTPWLGERLGGLADADPLLLIAAVTVMTVFLTEVTSNTATASLLLPLMATLAQATGLPPMLLMVPTALAASCAFMLPVATPPNAVVFASQYLSIPQMAKAGLWLNLIASALITLGTWWLLPEAWR